MEVLIVVRVSLVVGVVAYRQVMYRTYY